MSEHVRTIASTTRPADGGKLLGLSRANLISIAVSITNRAMNTTRISHPEMGLISRSCDMARYLLDIRMISP
jgi:hypothetical protein